MNRLHAETFGDKVKRYRGARTSRKFYKVYILYEFQVQCRHERYVHQQDRNFAKHVEKLTWPLDSIQNSKLFKFVQ